MSLLDTASLIVTPNGYKEGKLYSVIPSDGSGDMSVTRATTATRVNSAGLVELVPYNLASYSEQFDNADWTKLDSTIDANSITAPNGTLTADKINETNTTGFFIAGGSSTLNSSTEYTFSFYAKSAERTIARVLLGTGSFNAKYAYFNLSTGVTTTNATNSTIENVGNGWYRCTITDTTLSSPAPNSVYGWIGPSNNMTNAYNTYTGTAGNGIYIWGAQLVEGSVAKDYQKTETRLNIPRLDYSNGTCPSLLVEPQRTNLLTYSSSFDDASWTKSSTTITANTTISPSGVQDAETAVFGSNGQVYKPISSNAVNTFSTYVKKGTNRYFSIQLETNSVVYRAIYDLDTTSVTFTGTNTSASITDEGNGWFRVSVVNTTSDAIAYTTLQAASSGTSVSGGSGTFYIWGAQLEAGSYPTSYIPTTSASVTRNADVISKTGISSLIGQTEGTLFQDIYIDDILNAGSYYSFLAIGTTGNLMFMTFYSDGRIQFAMFNGNVLQVNIDAPSYGLTTGRHKMAVAYKNNDFAFYCDGNLVGTSNSGSVPATSKIDLTDTIGGKQRYNSAALWKTRLTNTQLAQLTTI